MDDLNELIKVKRKVLKECEDELSNFDYSFIVRDSLGFYHQQVQEEIERYEAMLLDVLKRDAGIS